MHFPRTRAQGVRVCVCVRRPLRMCSTGMPRTASASAISPRWQRQGTASAHITAARCLRSIDQQVQVFLEFVRLHVVGKTAKRSIAPCLVARIGARTAQPSQAGNVLVVDIGGAKRIGQGFPVELGIVPGTRHRANIDHQRHLVRLEKVDECLQSARRMANRQNELGLFRGLLLHSKTRQQVVPRDSTFPIAHRMLCAGAEDFKISPRNGTEAVS